LREKVEYFSDEEKGLIEVLQRPDLLVPSVESNCKVVQRYPPIRVSLQAKVEGFSVEDNGLLKVPRRSKPVITVTEMLCKQF
jgi:hypothetical protein